MRMKVLLLYTMIWMRSRNTVNQVKPDTKILYAVIQLMFRQPSKLISEDVIIMVRESVCVCVGGSWWGFWGPGNVPLDLNDKNISIYTFKNWVSFTLSVECLCIFICTYIILQSNAHLKIILKSLSCSNTTLFAWLSRSFNTQPAQRLSILRSSPPHFRLTSWHENPKCKLTPVLLQWPLL